MSMYFAEDPGKIEVVPWYAGNEIFLQEIKFSVPASEWNEFRESDLFRHLEEYVDSLRTQDMSIGIHELRDIEGIETSLQNQTNPLYRGSVWARFRKLFRRRKLNG